MKKTIANISFLVFTIWILIMSLWGPEIFARYTDKRILDEIHLETEAAGDGYRYTLSSGEKLYILSECLNSQTLPGSEQDALIRNEGVDYQKTAGTYAFVLNHKRSSGEETTDQETYEICNRELDVLKKLGILPDSVRDVEAAAYNAVLYSAIDVLEPRNNVAVWKISLSDSQKNANKENALIDAYIDADNGKIYEFYVRTELVWENIDPDEIIGVWREYMGLPEPVPYESGNPLIEMTPYYKKYAFSAMGEENTIVTIGFYEGINELFLKITK